MGHLIQETERSPSRPFVHSGICDACRAFGRVFTSFYAISGGRSVLRTLCLDWQACAERGGCDEVAS